MWMQVMTNSPTFDQQIALNEYWKSIGGMVGAQARLKRTDGGRSMQLGGCAR
jgi:penicillin V acylase-like amidase (Ntn superfamily)